jgi:hypothetical protein
MRDQRPFCHKRFSLSARHCRLDRHDRFVYHGAYIREGGNAASGALRTAQKQGARLWELRAATNMAASGAIKASAPTPAT